MSWLLSPSSAAKITPRLMRKASTVSSWSGPEEDGDALDRASIDAGRRSRPPAEAGPEAGAIAQCVDRPAEDYSPSRCLDCTGDDALIGRHTWSAGHAF